MPFSFLPPSPQLGLPSPPINGLLCGRNLKVLIREIVSGANTCSTQRVASGGIPSLHPEQRPPLFSEERSGTQRLQLLQSEGTLKNGHDPDTTLRSLHPLYPHPSSESRSEWTGEEGVEPLSLETRFHLKDGRAFISHGLCSLSPGLPQYFCRSRNIPYLGPWVLVLCCHVLSLLLDHKFIERRENVYCRDNNNGKRCVLST